MSLKKILSLALAAVMTLTLAACGSSEQEGEASVQQTAGVAVQVTEVTAADIKVDDEIEIIDFKYCMYRVPATSLQP